MQGHYNTTTSVAAVESSIKKFEALGVKISISELDVCDYTVVDGKMTEEQEIEQAQKYASLFKMFKRHSDSIERVTIWGIDDGTSWRSETCPLIFDKDYQPKQAYYALLDPDKYLEEHPYTAKATNQAYSYKGTPVIDGEAEELWDDVPEYDVNRFVMAWQGSTAKLKSMWDENNLYVLMDVTDTNLSTVSSETYMQDSVEVFVDENNEKTPSYEDNDDAQYRVSCENVQSFGSGAIQDKFKTAVTKTDHGYLVEMAIPFHTPRTGTGIIGFDAQVNDDSKGDGNRTSVAKFCDMTDLSWGNTEYWGEMFLSEHGERDDILVNLNGKTLSFDVPPMIINDRTMVPFRKILEELDAKVEYESDGQYITATRSDTEIKLQVNNETATVNGKEVKLDAAPVIVDDRTLIPVRFIAENLNAKVDWDSEKRVVGIIPD
jgi:endo-1,4-beta-xylanase